MNFKGLMKDFLGKDGFEKKLLFINPQDYITKDFPPTYLMTAVADFLVAQACGVRSGTTENELMLDGSPRGDFFKKQLLFSFKKRNKQSAYVTGTAGNKVKCDGGHTTVNVWI